MTDETDANDVERGLAERSRHGSREAFEELVKLTARGLFARLYLETGNSDRAEDLVQETYLLAWRSIRSLSDPRVFRAWLIQIAHTAVIDASRRETRKKRAGIHQATQVYSEESDPENGPSEDAELNEERGRMLAVLRSMPREYREPLMLRYLAGADYETISRELGLTNGALRGLLGRGMKMLRERMQAREKVL
jgi:RNA polymerase sigma-70 factor (ECF subfamily)